MKHLRLARLFLALCSISATAADETSIVLIDAPDRDFTTAHCAICPDLDYITMNAPVMDRARWRATVQKMIDRFRRTDRGERRRSPRRLPLPALRQSR
ncbi:MAG: hypothetical protein H7A15_06710 [Sinobacteraceae bacterium]|nr:hypothetical protein [Nevskiaceae bacterium]